MVISSRTTPHSPNPIVINNDIIHRVDSYKYLATIIENKCPIEEDSERSTSTSQFTFYAN